MCFVCTFQIHHITDFTSLISVGFCVSVLFCNYVTKTLAGLRDDVSTSSSVFLVNTSSFDLCELTMRYVIYILEGGGSRCYHGNTNHDDVFPKRDQLFLCLNLTKASMKAILVNSTRETQKLKRYLVESQTQVSRLA